MIVQHLITRIVRSGISEGSKCISALLALLFFPIQYRKIAKEIEEYKFDLSYDLNVPYIVFDVIYSLFFYSMSIEEPTYLALSLFNKTKLERDSFLLKDYKLVYKNIDTTETRKITADKYTSYSFLKQFYKRQMIRICIPEDNSKLELFLKNYPKTIIKPESGKKGAGIKVFIAESNNNIDSFIHSLSTGSYVVEEYIEQNSFMKSLHPSSVNTIRFVTSNINGEVRNLYAMLRIGVNGNTVDNASAGGICAAVNIETGEITSEGKRRNGERYLKHPNTNVLIKGNQIPYWSNLIHMVDDIMHSLPNVKYVGWDFALTCDGWCIIEGNNKPSFLGIQMCQDEGIKQLVKDKLELKTI